MIFSHLRWVRTPLPIFSSNLEELRGPSFSTLEATAPPCPPLAGATVLGRSHTLGLRPRLHGIGSKTIRIDMGTDRPCVYTGPGVSVYFWICYPNTFGFAFKSGYFWTGLENVRQRRQRRCQEIFKGTSLQQNFELVRRKLFLEEFLNQISAFCETFVQTSFMCFIAIIFQFKKFFERLEQEIKNKKAENADSKELIKMFLNEERKLYKEIEITIYCICASAVKLSVIESVIESLTSKFEIHFDKFRNVKEYNAI